MDAILTAFKTISAKLMKNEGKLNHIFSFVIVPMLLMKMITIMAHVKENHYLPKRQSMSFCGFHKLIFVCTFPELLLIQSYLPPSFKCYNIWQDSSGGVLF